ncbi:hypothetical protein B0H10DRAFT_1971781 [Mycena sp. CBHHK59/15]|nr:hypothetical protein B0H10DRAFT_1971781 [Mycena sp. CBHHK59/15]
MATPTQVYTAEWDALLQVATRVELWVVLPQSSMITRTSYGTVPSFLCFSPSHGFISDLKLATYAVGAPHVHVAATFNSAFKQILSLPEFANTLTVYFVLSNTDVLTDPCSVLQAFIDGAISVTMFTDSSSTNSLFSKYLDELELGYSPTY